MTGEGKKNLLIIAISLAFYCVNRFSNLLKSVSCVGFIFRNHFNDYLGGIVFISYVNLLMVRGERKTFTTFPWMLCWSGVCSLCWEGIAPTILSYSTADWRDCIAYLLGMLTYWALFKKQY